MAKRLMLRITLFALGATLAVIGPAHSQDLFGGWRDGDIVMLEAELPGSDELKNTTGSPYTHVAMVRMTGGGPVALETLPTLWEIDVSDFIEKGRGGRFAVYRVKGLTYQDSVEPPHVANDYLHTPFDKDYGDGATALYGAELVRLAYRAIRIELGREVRIGGRMMVTPSSIANDPLVKCVFSNFPSDRQRCSGSSLMDDVRVGR